MANELWKIMKAGGERGGRNRQSFFQWAGAEGERERERE